MMRSLTAVFALVLILLLAPGLCVVEPGEPLPQPHVPQFHKGTLFLVGGGECPKSVRRRFIDLAGGANARLTVIPSASAERNHLGIKEYWQKVDVASVEFVHCSREQANCIDFYEVIANSTGVWMSGGDQESLAGLYRNTKIEQALRQVLDKGGVVGGTSAGASVVSEHMIAGDEDIQEGFGLLDTVIVDQHFNTRQRIKRLLRFVARFPYQFGLGIDESTAAEIHNNSICVWGESGITICTWNGKPKCFPAGKKISFEEAFGE